MHVGLSDMSDEMQQLFTFNNILSFDDIIKKNWVEVWSEQKGQKTPTLVQVRKATFPSRNAMLLNEELEIMKIISGPFFSSVEDLRKDYHDKLFELGYSEFAKLVSKRYGVRHVILQNIASVTTKRLQNLRKTVNIGDIKKKQVTRERLVTYLSQIKSPLESFSEELDKILSSEQKQICYGILAAEFGIEPSQVKSFLLLRIAKVYVNQKIYSGEADPIFKFSYEKDERKIASYELCYKKLVSCVRSCDLIQEILVRITRAETPDFRGILYRKLFSLCGPYITKFSEAKSAYNDSLPTIIKGCGVTVKYFDTLNVESMNYCGVLSNICASFVVEYKKTSMSNTLPKSQDETLAAWIKKVVDAERASTIFKK